MIITNSMRGKVPQQRTGRRAPHGAPEFTERISIFCTAKQKRKFMRKGRASQWLRDLIDAAG